MKLKRLIIYILILLFGVIFGMFLRHNKTTWEVIRKPLLESYKRIINTDQTIWSKDFEVVEIRSHLDNKIQKAFFYKSKSNSPAPLIISLHTWYGYYYEKDKLAELCKSRDINYIHPDFRGANLTKDACCSELALSDIDESITFAIENSNVDTTRIFVIGLSGGGYATLCTFMKSRHKIKKFSAWASISDLIAFYKGIRIMKYNVYVDILNCTESKNGLLNENVARQKSPIYWNTPLNKLTNSEIYLYAGIYDGLEGSVTITQSINFYNKLLSDLSVADSSKYVSNIEKIQLLEYRRPLANYGKISDRNICLQKAYMGIKLTIFEGGHEMLTEFALNELLAE